MTTTNDAGTLREKIIGLVIDVYQSGYYFGSIGADEYKQAMEGWGDER
jgi:hypothetical protein